MEREEIVAKLIKHDDLDWFCENFIELHETYGNDWLAIKDQTVVAHAATGRELAEKINVDHLGRCFLTKADPKTWSADYMATTL